MVDDESVKRAERPDDGLEEGEGGGLGTYIMVFQRDGERNRRAPEGVKGRAKGQTPGL